MAPFCFLAGSNFRTRDYNAFVFAEVQDEIPSGKSGIFDRASFIECRVDD